MATTTKTDNESYENLRFDPFDSTSILLDNIQTTIFLMKIILKI